MNNYSECGRTLETTTSTRTGRTVKTGHQIVLTKLNVDRATQPGEFPHMCIIYKIVNENRLEYIGGGSLIARNKIVTVAHKFHV